MLKRLLIALGVVYGVSWLLPAQAQSIFPPSGGLNTSACTNGWVLYKSSGDPCEAALSWTVATNVLTLTGGASSGVARLDVGLFPSVIPTSRPSVRIGGDANDGDNGKVILASSVNFADNPYVEFYSFRGDEASPTALNNGNGIGQISFKGYDGAAFGTSALISAYATASGASSAAIQLSASGALGSSLILNGLDGTSLFSGSAEASGYIVTDGFSLKTDTTTAHTAKLQAYDVNGTAYVTAATLTNGNAPSFVIAPSGDLTVSLQGTYKSNDGTAGVTVSACTSFKNGLCVAGT